MTNMQTENWLSDPSVVEWLQMINTERTVRNYKQEFPNFMRYVVENTEYKTPTQIIESRKTQLENKDYAIKRFWENAVIGYMHALELREFKKNTIMGYLRTVLSFFSKTMFNSHIQEMS